MLKELLSACIRSGRRGYWTVRLSMDLDHLGRKEESLQVAEKGVTDPLIRGGDLVALQRRVVRLSKPPRRWKKPPYAEALDLKVEEVSVTYLCLDLCAHIKDMRTQTFDQCCYPFQLISYIDHLSSFLRVALLCE